MAQETTWHEALVPGDPHLDVPEVAVRQVLTLADNGVTFYRDPAGFWTDQYGLTGTLLRSHTLGRAIEYALGVGLATTVCVWVEGRGWHQVLRAEDVHLSQASTGVTDGSWDRPACLASTPGKRYRVTNNPDRVTCGTCRNWAKLVDEDTSLARRMQERGIGPEAIVTFPGSSTQWVVARVEAGFARLFRTDELGEPRWVYWEDLQVLRPAPGTGDESPDESSDESLGEYPDE